MESSRDDERLAEALEALRPAPSIAFVAELDERVAAGFPRPARSGTEPLTGLGARLRTMKPRQLLPSAATAVAAIAVVTALVASNQGAGTNPSTDLPATSAQEHSRAKAGPQGSGGGEPLSDLNKFGPETKAAGSGGETSAPSSSAANAKAVPPADVEAMAGGDAGALNDSIEPLSASLRAIHRDVERSTEMVLGTDPEGVADASAQVFEAVHAAHGVVLRSSSTNGSEGHAGAQFDLLIPSGRLDDALAAFSGIAEVRSRHDGTVDITAPTVGANERLQDSQARIDALLNELAASETEAEREAIEAQLGSERRKSARLGAQLTALHKRASLSRVSLRIVADGSSTGSSGGGWDAGDAIGDAGRILAVAAGVTIVGLAVLGPIALLALVLWLANRAWVRRGRERALS
jgi:hypothetical protein